MGHFMGISNGSILVQHTVRHIVDAIPCCVGSMLVVYYLIANWAKEVLHSWIGAIKLSLHCSFSRCCIIAKLISIIKENRTIEFFTSLII